MRLVQFKTKGSGTNGQGPGVIGNMILDKAGVMIELPETHPMVGVLSGFNGVEHVGYRMVLEEGAIIDPELSVEEGRQSVLDGIRERLAARTTSIAVIRRIAGKSPKSKSKKAAMIDAIMKSLDKNDTAVMDRVMLAFNA